MKVLSLAESFAAATSHEMQGRWSEAVRVYERAYRIALGSGDADGLNDTIVRLGHCLRQAGQTELALETLELAAEMAERRGDGVAAARSLNGIAILNQAAGDLNQAEANYARAFRLAESVGDRQRMGEAQINLGTLDNIRGNLEGAREHYLAGLEHVRAAGADRYCGHALNNLGMLHVDLLRFEEAEDYFRQALQIYERLGDIVAAATTQINRTELFLELERPELARASCDEGFEIASRVGDPSLQAEALKFYGIIYRVTGKLHLAEIHLRRAIEITAEREPLLEAEAQRELSLVLRGLERNREALEALNRAHALFAGLQARSDQADIRERMAQLEEDFLSLVRTWGESIEAKDRYTAGHCVRVAEYACRLAERAGLAEHEIVWFRMGAFLHDLGKTEVPAEILNKPGRLTPDERTLMERHTVVGEAMLARVEFPWDVRPMVRSHHERWDGSGYPDGLAGLDIHPAARILRIADIFDALTTARSYREPLSPDQAYQAMEEDEGSFDPELFAHFQELFPDFAEYALQAMAGDGDEAQVPAPLPSFGLRTLG